jgi:hypothetical protein
MKCLEKGSGHLLFLTTLLIALCFSITIIANAEKPAPSPKAGPTTPEKKGQPVAKPGDAQAKKGAEYAACSPQFPGEQIADMMGFVASLSPDLPDKLKPILLKCDVDVNGQLLGMLEDLQQQVADAQFDNEDQEKRFLDEKAREIEIQVLLTQKPVKEAELKKLVADIFEIRQNNMKDEAAGLEKEAANLKKRVEERQKAKDQIVERKLKEMTSETPPKAAEGGPPGEDKLSWD